MKPDPNRAAAPPWDASVRRSASARGDIVVEVIDDRRVPQHEVEFRTERRLASILLAALVVVVFAAIPVAAGLPGPNWWVDATAIAIFLVLAAYFGRALYSSVAVTGTGIQVKNAFQGELSADWDRVDKVQIRYGRTWMNCRIVLSGGTTVKLHAFDWPGHWNVLQNVRKWLAEYDSPLRHQDQRTAQITFRNDMPHGETPT